jgi:hypothetical protein
MRQDIERFVDSMVRHFGMTKRQAWGYVCKFRLWAYQKVSLDVVKLDDWLHEAQGYREAEHGSMRDFIRMKFGEGAVSFCLDSMGGADVPPRRKPLKGGKAMDATTIS